MPNILRTKTVLNGLFFWLLYASAHAAESQNATSIASVAGNVPYSKVAALPFKPADEKIAYGPGENQFGLLWRVPEEEARQRPLVVFIHGGCWLSEYSIDHSFALTSALAQVGYPVWSLEYRRTGDTGGGWPITFEDIKLAIDHAHRVADSGQAHEGLIVIGHSAGGHLALLAAGEHWSNTRTEIKAVIGLAAIVDLPKYSQGSNSCELATPAFMAGDYVARKSAYEAANPLLKKFTMPVLLLQGDTDHIVNSTQAVHGDATTILLSDTGHFDWLHPGSAAFRELLVQLEQVSN